MNIFKLNFVYSALLHRCLTLSKSVDQLSDNGSLDNGGFYVVVLRSDKNNNKLVEIKYLYYPSIFLFSFLAHVIVRDSFTNRISFREWGDYLVVIDKNISDNNLVIDLLRDGIKFNEHWDKYMSSGGKVEYKNYQEALDILKKLTVSCSDMSKVIDFAVKKEFDDLFGVFSDTFFVNSDEDKSNLYFIKDCLFICPDINDIINQLKLLGYTTKKVTKNKSITVNSSEMFLFSIDNDYRNSLYNYHTNQVNIGNIPRNCLLPQSKFSFKNIHMNIGNVRLYSTIPNNKVGVSRSNLFEENYDFIGSLLKKNYYIGSVDLQKKIEMFLHNQEDIFKDNVKLKKILKNNEESFTLLENKRKDLCKLLSHPHSIEKNSKFVSNKYLSLVDEIISVLGVENTANLLLSYFLGILSKETLRYKLETDEVIETPGIFTTVCYNSFGKLIFNKFIYTKYKESKEKISFSEYINTIKNNYSIIYEEDNSYESMAGYFVWKLVVVGLLEENLGKHPENRQHSVHYLRVSDKYRSKFLVSQKVYRLPQKLPMICEPKFFEKTSEGMKLGGFLLNDERYSVNLIKSRIGTDKETIINDDNILIDMINNYMKTPFKINKDTLEFIHKYGVEKGIVENESRPDILKFMKDPYGKYSDKKSKEMRSLVSKIIMEKNILSIAETYANMDKIYFPVGLDFRTRIYANTDYFDYQKSDLAKGLILFATPGKIKKSDFESIQYFKAFGANMYGKNLDKKSLLHRVKWIDSNTERILNYENNDIINEAENKVCFASFCFEFKRFMGFLDNREDVVFNTYLPIQLDATCNGYQHLALLTREKKLLKKLNLSGSTFNQDPEDLYIYINDELSKYVKKEIDTINNIKSKTKEDENKLDSLTKISKLNFGRKILKDVIMKESYSAGVPSLVNDVLASEHITEKTTDSKTKLYTYKNSDIVLTRSNIYFYVGCIKRVISNIAPKIKLLSDYLNSIARICTNLQIEIPWTLPHGAVIAQSYLASKDSSIRPFSFTKSKYTFKKYIEGSYDKGKQRRALRPNLIHSLDATTIALLYNSLPKNTSLYTVHDCFAVTGDSVPMLIRKLKLAYIKLYSDENYLIKFDAFVRLTINRKCGDSIFKIDSNYINIPNRRKAHLVEFPNLNDILNIDKNKFKKVPFPNIANITSPDVAIDEIEDAIYLIN